MKFALLIFYKNNAADCEIIAITVGSKCLPVSVVRNIQFSYVPYLNFNKFIVSLVKLVSVSVRQTLIYLQGNETEVEFIFLD